MQNEFISDIGKSILFSSVFGVFGLLIKIPNMLSFIVAGIVIGPNLGISLISNQKSINEISEIGLVLLMFILGLEINVKKIIESGKTTFIAGVMQVSFSLVFNFLLMKLLLPHDVNSYRDLYFSFALSLSSTLIVVKILTDYMELDTLPSRITLGVLVVQDIVAIMFLAILPNLAHFKLSELFISITSIATLITVAFLVARFVLPKVFSLISKQTELMLVTSLAWCFFICGAAHYLKLSIEMGGLVAGISIASFPYHLDIAAKISSLRDFFITLFFVSLGMQIPIPSMDNIAWALLFTLIIYCGRFLSMFPFLYFNGYGHRASLLPPINLSQLSEFSLVICSIGISLNHIDGQVLNVLILTLIITAMISSFVIPESHRIYKKISTVLMWLKIKDEIHLDTEATSLNEGKIIILGFFREASSLLHELLDHEDHGLKEKILVLDFNPEVHRKLKKMGVRSIFGDVANPDMLKMLQLEGAELVISTLPNRVLKGTTNQKILHYCKNINPKIPVILSAETFQEAQELYDGGAAFVNLSRLNSAEQLKNIVHEILNHGQDQIRIEHQDLVKNRREILA